MKTGNGHRCHQHRPEMCSTNKTAGFLLLARVPYSEALTTLRSALWNSVRVCVCLRLLSSLLTHTVHI